MFWPTLIMALSIATVAYVILKVRRTLQARRARSEERATAMLARLRADVGMPNRAAAAPVPALSPSWPPTAHAPPATAMRGLVPRSRLLTEDQRSVFALLRAALPEHVTMALVRVADLVDQPESAATLEREPQLRQVLLERIDCVVCSPELVPIAAIALEDTGVGHAPVSGARSEALRQLGVKFVQVRADSLPPAAEMRALILG